MFNKLVVSFALAGLALVAAPASHKVTLFEEAVVNGTTLKPGDYKLTVDGSKATLSRGKQTVEAPVTEQKNDSKYGATSVRFNTAAGKPRIQEIRLGGTDTKVVFETGAAASSAAGGR